MNYSNPKLPEDTNLSAQHPLAEFSWMLAAVAAALAITLLVTHLLLAWLLPKINFSTEVKLAAYIEDRWFKIDNDTACQSKQASLQSLANKLAAAQGLDSNIKLTVHLVDSQEKNAFATLGGHIFILQGLVDSVQSENGLAMVLAHEIAHIKHRHPIISFGRGLVSSLIISGLGGQGADVIALSGAALLLSFSREQEQVSDQSAIASLQAYYGHSLGAEEFFTAIKQEEAGAGRWSDFLATHPGVDQRLEHIQQTQRGSQGAVTPMPGLIRLNCGAEAVP